MSKNIYYKCISMDLKSYYGNIITTFSVFAIINKQRLLC